MYFYSDLINLSKEKFYSKFAASCALIYSIRFLDFTIIAWLLTNVSDNPASIGALVFIKFIPMMFSGLITGWLVDKFSRLAIIKFVIISHRNNTVKNCDLIYVFDNGKLMDKGSYKEISYKYNYSQVKNN